MGALEANLAVAAAVLVMGLAAIMCITGLVSWRRIGHIRLLWVAVAFALLAANGLLLLQDALADRTGADMPWDGILLLAVVASLYIAVLR